MQPSASASVPTVQRAWRFEEPGGLRVGGLDKLPNAREAEFWLRRAAAEQDAGRPERAVEVLREALQRDVRPATSIARALAVLQKGDGAGITSVAQEETAPAPHVHAAATSAPLPPAPSESDARTEGLVLALPGGIPDAVPHTVHKAFTPSRTGLTGRAQRVPSRFARTPGPGADATLGGSAAAKGTTAGLETAGVLKKLTFSVAKPRLEAQLEALEAEMDTVRLGCRAAGREPATTTKHLRFGATPAGATTAGRGPRHVTFDASVANPASYSTGQAQGPTGQLPLATPEPPAAEVEDDGCRVSPSGGPSSTNTANAGHTPYDKRLSSLFRKYADSTPGGIAEDLLDSLEGESYSSAPCYPWHPLSFRCCCIATSVIRMPPPASRRASLALLEAPLHCQCARLHQAAVAKV